MAGGCIWRLLVYIGDPQTSGLLLDQDTGHCTATAKQTRRDNSALEAYNQPRRSSRAVSARAPVLVPATIAQRAALGKQQVGST
jgi:hypothetical protein